MGAEVLTLVGTSARTVFRASFRWVWERTSDRAGSRSGRRRRLRKPLLGLARSHTSGDRARWPGRAAVAAVSMLVLVVLVALVLAVVVSVVELAAVATPPTRPLAAPHDPARLSWPSPRWVKPARGNPDSIPWGVAPSMAASAVVVLAVAAVLVIVVPAWIVVVVVVLRHHAVGRWRTRRPRGTPERRSSRSGEWRNRGCGGGGHVKGGRVLILCMAVVV